MSGRLVIAFQTLGDLGTPKDLSLLLGHRTRPAVHVCTIEDARHERHVHFVRTALPTSTLQDAATDAAAKQALESAYIAAKRRMGSAAAVGAGYASGFRRVLPLRGLVRTSYMTEGEARTAIHAYIAEHAGARIVHDSLGSAAATVVRGTQLRLRLTHAAVQDEQPAVRLHWAGRAASSPPRRGRTPPDSPRTLAAAAALESLFATGLSPKVSPKVSPKAASASSPPRRGRTPPDSPRTIAAAAALESLFATGMSPKASPKASPQASPQASPKAAATRRGETPADAALRVQRALLRTYKALGRTGWRETSS